MARPYKISEKQIDWAIEQNRLGRSISSLSRELEIDHSSLLYRFKKKGYCGKKGYCSRGHTPTPPPPKKDEPPSEIQKILDEPVNLGKDKYADYIANH